MPNPKSTFLFQMTFEAGQTLRAGVDPELPGHGVEDARLNGMSRIIGIGAKAQTVTSVFFACVVVQECVGQQRDDAADAFFIVCVLLAFPRLFLGGAEQTFDAGLFLLQGFGVEQTAVNEDEAADRTGSGLDPLLQSCVRPGVLFDPVAPVTMVLVVVEFVIDDLANQLARGQSDCSCCAQQHPAPKANIKATTHCTRIV